MKLDAYTRRAYRSKGSAYGSSQRRLWPNGVGPDLPISNPNSWVFGQAQARIISKGNAFGQAQADIKQTYNAFGQSQADIKQTYNSFGQAQAYIVLTLNAFGQAQGSILNAVGNGYGQAQADILQTYQAYGQAQSDIKATTYVFGQAQADVKAISRGFGQAKADILATSRKFGQAQGKIIFKQNAYGQSAGQIKLIVYVSGQSAAQILNPIGRAYAQAQAAINGEFYPIGEVLRDTFTRIESAGSLGTPDIGPAYTSAVSLTEYNNTIVDGSTAIISGADPLDYLEAESLINEKDVVAQVDFLPANDSASQTPIRMWVRARQRPLTVGLYVGFEARVSRSQTTDLWTLTVQNWKTYDTSLQQSVTVDVDVDTWYTLKVVVQGSDKGAAKLWKRDDPEPSDWTLRYTQVSSEDIMEGHGGVVIYSDIGITASQVSKIDNLNAYHIVTPTTRSYGQARAVIYYPSQSGQAQALISATRNKFGLARAYIRFRGQFGQAAAYIAQDKVFGQALGMIERVESANGQAAAVVIYHRRHLGQAQASIKARPYGFGQAQAFIEDHMRHGQAQAFIRNPRQFGQAQGFIAKSIGYGQAQATIIGRPINTGQARAKVLSSGQLAGYQIVDQLPDAFTYNLSGVDTVIFGDLTDYAWDDTDPDPVNSGDNPPDGSWEDTYYDDLPGVDVAPNGWFKFTLDGTYTVTMTTDEFIDSFDHDTILGLYTGDSGPGNWTALDSSDDDDTSERESTITHQLSVGTYIVQVGFFTPLATPLTVNIHFTATPVPQFSGRGYGQALAKIKRITRAHGLAKAMITRKQGYGQAQGRVDTAEIQRFGQAQAAIVLAPNTYMPTGLAAALIVKGAGYGQTQARIYAFGQQVYGQAQARILASVTYYQFAQAQAIIRGPGFGQAQALITGEKYLVRFNNYDLPGWAQSESYDSIAILTNDRVSYVDSSFAEYVGLTNKIISLRMKVAGSTYRDVKDQVQTAATMVRSGAGFKKLYVQHTNKYYLVLTKSIKMEKSVDKSMRMLEYTVDWEAKPWLFGEEAHTISGTGAIATTGRTFANGGWTPATIRVTGTNVTISGYTDNDFTGFISISGAVTDLTINTETDHTGNYNLYVGPGVTNFTVVGATSLIVTWQDRWYL
jgi:hypothetical protein